MNCLLKFGSKRNNTKRLNKVPNGFLQVKSSLDIRQLGLATTYRARLIVSQPRRDPHASCPGAFAEGMPAVR